MYVCRYGWMYFIHISILRSTRHLTKNKIDFNQFDIPLSLMFFTFELLKYFVTVKCTHPRKYFKILLMYSDNYTYQFPGLKNLGYDNRDIYHCLSLIAQR